MNEKDSKNDVKTSYNVGMVKKIGRPSLPEERRLVDSRLFVTPATLTWMRRVGSEKIRRILDDAMEGDL